MILCSLSSVELRCQQLNVCFCFKVLLPCLEFGVNVGDRLASDFVVLVVFSSVRLRGLVEIISKLW